MQDYHQLDIWHRAMAFAVQVYQFSGMLPTDERYNLVTQLRRAAVSVPLNIAEDNQISRMVHAFIQRFGSPPTGGPDLGAHDS